MNRSAVSVSLFSTVLLAPAVSLAAGEDSLFPSVGRLAVAFVLVIALIYACVFLFRRFLMRGGGKANGSIKPVGSIPLGQKARLAVVEVGERAFLLGVTEQQVSMIAELDAAELSGLRPAGTHSFISHLRGFTRAYAGVKESSTG